MDGAQGRANTREVMNPRRVGDDSGFAGEQWRTDDPHAMVEGPVSQVHGASSYGRSGFDTERFDVRSLLVPAEHERMPFGAEEGGVWRNVTVTPADGRADSMPGAEDVRLGGLGEIHEDRWQCHR